VVFQIGIAFFGHNLIQVFERYAAPVLGVIFAIACVMIFAKAHYTVPQRGGDLGGFLIVVGATFGYAAGWNPYASDYTRYLPRGASRVRTGLFAGLGVFVSCVVLELAGAASTSLAVNADAPTSAFTSPLGPVVGKLTLLAIAIGAIAANAINIYSGALSFTAMGFRLPMRAARAITAVVFGVLGFLLALAGLKDAGHSYENFLLVISYWIGPWLGVVFTDQVLRRGHRVDGFLFDRGHNPFAGWVAMLVGIVLSVWLFANQSLYTGVVPQAVPQVGDIAFFVGFLIAGILYAVLFSVQRGRQPQDAVLVTPDEDPGRVTPVA
jgi:purine-cytosine permease-like protein